MKKYYKYLAIVTAILLFNCEAYEDTTLSDFVGFQIGPVTLAVTKDATSTKDISVYASEVSSVDRSYGLEVATTSTLKAKYVVPATVTIPANSNVGTFTVSVTDDENLAFLAQSLIIKFKSEAGLNFGNPVNIGVTEYCPDTLVRLALTFDSWPEETTVELFDLSGEQPVVIYKGGPYKGLKNADLDFCLTPGKYGLAVYDAYGDGGATFTVTSGTKTYVPKTTSKSATATATFTIE